MYVLQGEEESLLIDAGIGVGNLQKMVEQQVDTDIRLFLTHTHWDHLGGGHYFDTVNVHPRECTDDHRVTIDSLSDEFVGRPAQFVEDHREASLPFPDDFDPNSFEVPPITGVESVTAGDVIDLGNRTFELIALPGHSPGQLGILDREQGVLHGGDMVHGEKNLYIHFEDCDIEQYRETFDRVIELRDSGVFDTLTTGHTPPITGDELSILDHLQESLEAIVAGELTPETIETNWGNAHRYEFGDTEILTKTSV